MSKTLLIGPTRKLAIQGLGHPIAGENICYIHEALIVPNER